MASFTDIGKSFMFFFIEGYVQIFLFFLPMVSLQRTVNLFTLCGLNYINFLLLKVEFLPKFSVRGIWQRWRESYPADGTTAENAITVFTGVPTMYTRFIQGYEAMDPELQAVSASAASRLRLMMCGSSALPYPIMVQWESITGHRLLERYGMTEFVMALSNPLRGLRKGGTVGNPLPGVQVRIFSEDKSGSDTGVGELCVKSPSQFKEYWKRPEVTKESFTDDGYFKTGDTVKVDEDGYFIILGRTNADIMKVGGYKLSALEIEGVILEASSHLLDIQLVHPFVAECCVLGLSDKDYGEAVSAIIVPQAGAKIQGVEELKPAISLKELQTWAKEKLAPYKSILSIVKYTGLNSCNQLCYNFADTNEVIFMGLNPPQCHGKGEQKGTEENARVMKDNQPLCLSFGLRGVSSLLAENDVTAEEDDVGLSVGKFRHCRRVRQAMEGRLVIKVVEVREQIFGQLDYDANLLESVLQLDGLSSRVQENGVDRHFWCEVFHKLIAEPEARITVMKEIALDEITVEDERIVGDALIRCGVVKKKHRLQNRRRLAYRFVTEVRSRRLSLSSLLLEMEASISGYSIEEKNVGMEFTKTVGGERSKSSLNEVARVNEGESTSEKREGEEQLEFPDFPGSSLSVRIWIGGAFKQPCKGIMNKIEACPAQLNGNIWEVINPADEDPLALKYKTFKIRESLIDIVSREGVEVEAVLGELEISRHKKVNSKSAKVQKSHAKRKITGVVSSTEVKSSTDIGVLPVLVKVTPIVMVSKGNLSPVIVNEAQEVEVEKELEVEMAALEEKFKTVVLEDDEEFRSLVRVELSRAKNNIEEATAALDKLGQRLFEDGYSEADVVAIMEGQFVDMEEPELEEDPEAGSTPQETVKGLNELNELRVTNETLKSELAREKNVAYAAVLITACSEVQVRKYIFKQKDRIHQVFEESVDQYVKVEKEANLGRIQVELVSSQSEVEKLKSTVECLKGKCKDVDIAQYRIRSLELEAMELKGYLSNLREQLRKKEGELVRTRTDLSSVESDVEKLSDTVKRKEDSIQSTQSHCDKLFERLEKMKADISSSHGSKKEMMERLKRILRDIKDLRKQLGKKNHKGKAHLEHIVTLEADLKYVRAVLCNSNENIRKMEAEQAEAWDRDVVLNKNSKIGGRY
ncbi:hypothetical protein GIB67_025268 [Kingdonia uniflora]|uniref:Uncharacterized protein n=1 Tax=Kingdonia uniflora TaxID=39325 RepID=A0A7J7NBV1_9MAGN|nr:hypothetical protein GIB67_025268 [Kingdonia uniflora]